jgi:hypothetical protein
MGGGLALMHAADDGFSVASVNYGGLTRIRSARCPRMPHCRQLRRQGPLASVRRVPRILELALRAAGINHDIIAFFRAHLVDAQAKTRPASTWSSKAITYTLYAFGGLMPFKSQAQRRKFAHLLVEGKISNETFEEWNRETGGKKLPERAARKPTGRKKTQTTRKSQTRSGKRR